MTARRITLRSNPIGDGYWVWFYVYVYDTVAQLQRAAVKYSNDSGWYHENTLACFQPRYTVRYDSKGKAERCSNSKFLGFMRLTTEFLNPGIVIHECSHAATNYLRVLNLSSRYMIGNSIENEEAFAYAVQEFSYALLKKLEYLPNEA